ncbi:MAG: glycosyltransferase family 4 protein [Mucilaginibacter sp.]|nr:glycosyltransferase family 4 protein [Mucilaginibacter sp.]
MHFVFVSYNYSPDFKSPQDWITRINIYAGSLACLAQTDTVTRVEQIGYEGEYMHNGIRYCFTNFPDKKSKFQGQLNRFVKQLNPDVVVVHGLHYPLQVLQLSLTLGKSVKIIAQNHAEKPFTGIKKYVQLVADNYISAYFFASKAMGLDWVKKGNLKSPAKIQEVMEISSVFSSMGKELARQKTNITGKPVFLWVGRLNENKDPLNVVKAFLQYATVKPAAKLYMLYHTEELLDQINELLNSAINKDAIQLIGKVPHQELLYWYNSADFFISGSFYEGSGTAVCEAMSCGCVPVVTNIFSFRTITDNGNCGILYEAGSETALLNALIQTDQLDLKEKQEQCLQYFKEELSFEAIAVKMHDIAHSL